MPYTLISHLTPIFQPRDLLIASENSSTKPKLDLSKISNLACGELISGDLERIADQGSGGSGGDRCSKKCGETNVKSRGGKGDENKLRSHCTRPMNTMYKSSQEAVPPSCNVTTSHNKGHKVRTYNALGSKKYAVDVNTTSQTEVRNARPLPNLAKHQNPYKSQRQQMPRYVPVASIFGQMGYERAAESTPEPSTAHKSLGPAKYLPVNKIFSIEDAYSAQLPLISFKTWSEMHDAKGKDSAHRGDARIVSLSNYRLGDPILNSIVLFENGGRSIAELIIDIRAKPKFGVVVVAGLTFNTPYVLSAARHLKNHGVDVYLYSRENLDDTGEHIRRQYTAYKRCNGKATTGTYFNRQHSLILLTIPPIKKSLYHPNLRHGQSVSDYSSVIEAIRDKDEILILEVIGSSLPYMSNCNHMDNASQRSMLQACSQIMSAHGNAELFCVDIPSIFGMLIARAVDLLCSRLTLPQRLRPCSSHTKYWQE